MAGSASAQKRILLFRSCPWLAPNGRQSLYYLSVSCASCCVAARPAVWALRMPRIKELPPSKPQTPTEQVQAWLRSEFADEQKRAANLVGHFLH